LLMLIIGGREGESSWCKRLISTVGRHLPDHWAEM
jgi:hypothetical protein